MASATIQGGITFPEGATVGAYLRSQWGVESLSGAPTGAAVATATVTGGNLAFTGLADNTEYVAYAQVSGQDRFRRFSTPPAAAPAGGGTTLTAARVRATAIQSLANAGDNWLIFAAEDYDTASFHDNVTNNTRLTAPVHGIYDVGATCEFAANTGGKRELAIIVNRLTALARDGRAALVSGTTRLTIGNAPFELLAGDYVEISAVQSASGAIDTVVASGTISGVAAWISLRVAL